VGAHDIGHHLFRDVPSLLPKNAVLVLNDTRVLKARLFGERPTGGRVELLLCAPRDDNGRRFSALAKTAKPLRVGDIFVVGGTRAIVARARGDDNTLEIEFDRSAYALMEEQGSMPLPPYIQRPAGPSAGDEARYQTVYAKHPGAVAAPTAGLHMTDALLAAIRARPDVNVATLTLHVGPGTFQPVRALELSAHAMHGEAFCVPEQTQTLCFSGRPVVALGTTVVRALEAFARDPEVGERFSSTEIFIRPGFDFRVVTHLITNFHLPESTLLMLVCAFGGYERVMAAYRSAIASGYRFYSYGDAMMIDRADGRMPA
jgi:S-adenosylmethionine:tRNA ribosyltransferase-isomerase